MSPGTVSPGTVSPAQPKVVYWNNQPTPYVVARLNAVADLGTVQLEAWFDGMREPDRSWDVDPSTWRFPARMLTPVTVAGRSMPLPLAELRHVRPDVLIANYDRAHHMLGAAASLAASARTAVRCLPTFSAWERPTVTTETAKRLLFSAVDGAKVPGEDGRRYAGRYGLPASRSWDVTQSIDVDLYSQGRLDDQTRRQTRQRLGLHGCVFVYVGRIWQGKGLDTLFQAFRQLRSCEPDVCLLMVGNGPDEDRYRAETADLPDVIWHGFAQPRDTPALYGSADVMVFPTLGDPNGLVVEEAMVAGLPVITSDAAGDIRSRVIDGVTGYVVEAGTSSALRSAMATLAGAPEQRRRLGVAAAAAASRFRPEQYARDFDAFVTALLAAPRRRTLAAILGRVAGAALLTAGRRLPCADVIPPPRTP